MLRGKWLQLVNTASLRPRRSAPVEADATVLTTVSPRATQPAYSCIMVAQALVVVLNLTVKVQRAAPDHRMPRPVATGGFFGTNEVR